MRLLGIDHVVLRVRDAERSAAFYCDALGCTIERRQEAIGMVQLRAGDALIDLVALDGVLGRKGGAGPGAEGRNMDHLCLRVEAFDPPTVTAHLAAHGIAPERWEALLPVMAEQAVASGSPANNPLMPSAEEIIALYRQVWAA